MRLSLLAFTAAMASGVVANPAPNLIEERATATKGVEVPSSVPVTMQPVVQGCFSSKGNLTLNSTQMYNSAGKCGGEICQALGAWVAATSQGNECYCGDAYPSSDDVVDDKYCNAPCTGYGQEACGGADYYTVYNTGIQLYGVPVYDDSSSSSSSSATGAKTTSKATSTQTPTVATTVNGGGQTIYVTQSPTEAAAETSAATKKSSSNTVGIAVGTVVGVVVAAAAIGGVVFFMRRRRNKEIEDEYRRNAAVNAFFNGKPPGSSGGYSGSDSRLDPVMAQRRLSDGSIADNQDYSRKILRVTNA